jgi:superoxide dismutase, Fe-Mn family
MGEAIIKRRQFLARSDWAWLAANAAGALEILPLGNADTPLKYAKEPVLTIDVWEHADCIDYRNERARYVDCFWKAVNWDFAGQCYAAAVK